MSSRLIINNDIGKRRITTFSNLEIELSVLFILQFCLLISKQLLNQKKKSTTRKEESMPSASSSSSIVLPCESSET